VDSIVAQPKLLALLTYLTLAPPDATRRRDLLISVFWPELPESNARNSLNQSLHRLRQALDPDVIVSHGTNEVGIDKSRLSCDALDFVQVIEAAELEMALALYRGDLLAGVFVPGAPDFERWVDGERAKLRHLAFEAAMTLGGHAEDGRDLASASRSYRRAMRIFPERGTAVRQLMNVLARSGNPVEAVLEFDRFAARLEEDYDLQPSEETRAVLETIRSSLAADASPPRGRGAPSALTGTRATLPTSRPAAGEATEALEAPAITGPVGRRGPRAWQLVAGLITLAAMGAGIWTVTTGGSPASETTHRSAIPLDSTAIAILPFQVVGADRASPIVELAQSMGLLFELKVTGEFGRRILDPGSVVERWLRAGGSQDTALTAAAALQLGRDLGAGAVVRGTLVQSDAGIMLAASMVDVPTGSTRVPAVRVDGSLDERYELVDELIVLLLARDAGYSTAEAPGLARFEPEAVQAYLTGDWQRALEADSNLVDAAVWKFSVGEWDTAALRYAWEHQDQLSERAHAALQVYAAGDFDDGIMTMAQKIAGWEALARRWPEWGLPWGELGGNLAVGGALASVPDWRRRAREALDGERPGSWALWHLTELAFMAKDTARARDLVDRFVAEAADGSIFAFIPPRAPSYRWRLAILEGDTAGATRALAHTPESTWLPGFALLDGRGIADADQVVAEGQFEWWSPDNWAWARGLHPQWREEHQRHVQTRSDVRRYSIRVFRALLLGPSEDSTGVEAIRRLERMASGTGSEPSTEDRTRARCWITLWHLEHGDAVDARQTLRHIAGSDRPGRFASWAALIDVLLTRLEGGDVHASLLRADSVVRAYPLGTHRYEAEAHNLILARLLREYGEPERALSAIRRRTYSAPFLMQFDFTSMPEYLREEARLAAELGDVESAIEAYRHYFALRNPRPDHPPWAAQWDSMRVEYGALTGVEGP
jgi:DNA-binding SARP family transcriptional activator/TolB-like protein